VANGAATLGFALAAALAAALARPARAWSRRRRRGFAAMAGEWGTAARLRAPSVAVALNHAGTTDVAAAPAAARGRGTATDEGCSGRRSTALWRAGRRRAWWMPRSAGSIGRMKRLALAAVLVLAFALPVIAADHRCSSPRRGWPSGSGAPTSASWTSRMPQITPGAHIPGAVHLDVARRVRRRARASSASPRPRKVAG